MLYLKEESIVCKFCCTNYWTPCVLYVVGLHSSYLLSVSLISLSVTANVSSIYLAYILIYVLHDLCVLCVTVYVINFFVLICSVVMWRHLVNSAKLVHRVNSEKLKVN